MKWFKHDSCANRDAKLEKILLRYGADGYALYWLSLELIADRIEKDHITFELEHDAETLGARLRIDTLRVEEIMKYFIKLELFENEGDRITCLKLANRIENSMVKSQQIKEIQESIRENPGKSGKTRARLEEIREEKIEEREDVADSAKSAEPPPPVEDLSPQEGEATKSDPPVSHPDPSPPPGKSVAIRKGASKDPLPEDMAPTFASAKAAFDASDKARAIMYQDPASAAREVKALKLLVRRVHKLCPEDPSGFFAAVLRRYRELLNGKLRDKAAWTPSCLATAWIWTLVLDGIKAEATPEEAALAEGLKGIFAKRRSA